MRRNLDCINSYNRKGFHSAEHANLNRFSNSCLNLRILNKLTERKLERNIQISQKKGPLHAENKNSVPMLNGK